MPITIKKKRQVEIRRQLVPQLSREVIANIKAAAMRRVPPEVSTAAAAMAFKADSIRAPNERRSGLLHPAGYAGAPELATLRARLAAGKTLQGVAKQSLITGEGVPPKYVNDKWYPPVDTPPGNYSGPYAMERMLTDWGGWAQPKTTCPPNYPADAPKSHCGHYAFVEMDASVAYRSALAYAATGDERYATQAMRVVSAWAQTNKVFGVSDRNGPLEAAWGVASMARAMDILKATWPGYTRGQQDLFVNWVARVAMREMDYYVDVLNPELLRSRSEALRTMFHGNWPASIADAMMAVGALSDDRFRYEKGLALYRVVVDSYFRFGRGDFKEGHIVGEATETLRDVYHTLFGIGSLVQVRLFGSG